MSEWQPAILIAAHGRFGKSKHIRNGVRVMVRPAKATPETMMNHGMRQGCDAAEDEWYQIKPEDAIRLRPDAGPLAENCVVCKHEILTD
jgi:hypothetical protein